jgi:hypothetical protein
VLGASGPHHGVSIATSTGLRCRSEAQTPPILLRSSQHDTQLRTLPRTLLLWFCWKRLASFARLLLMILGQTCGRLHPASSPVMVPSRGHDHKPHGRYHTMCRGWSNVWTLSPSCGPGRIRVYTSRVFLETWADCRCGLSTGAQALFLDDAGKSVGFRGVPDLLLASNTMSHLV